MIEKAKDEVLKSFGVLRNCRLEKKQMVKFMGLRWVIVGIGSTSAEIVKILCVLTSSLSLDNFAEDTLTTLISKYFSQSIALSMRNVLLIIREIDGSVAWHLLLLKSI